MRQIQVLLLALALGHFSNLTSGEEPSTVPLATLTTEQAKFLQTLQGKWIPKKVLLGGKIFNEKVALNAILVKRATFEWQIPGDSKPPFKCTRISAIDQELDLVTFVNEKPVRYLMKLDGETMWLVTKASDRYETEWTAEPTRFNLCILLEREPN